jgi:hypothetical protein
VGGENQSADDGNRGLILGQPLSSLTQQCVSGRRFEDIPTLAEETSAWSTDINDTQRGVDWQMNVNDARTKFKSVYPKIKA